MHGMTHPVYPTIQPKMPSVLPRHVNSRQLQSASKVWTSSMFLLPIGGMLYSSGSNLGLFGFFATLFYVDINTIHDLKNKLLVIPMMYGNQGYNPNCRQ